MSKYFSENTHRFITIINLLYLIKSVSTIPDECMGVGLGISTNDVIGNEAFEKPKRKATEQSYENINELTFSRTHSQHHW